MFTKFAAVLLAATVVAAPAFARTASNVHTGASVPAKVKVVKHVSHHRHIVAVKKIKKIHLVRHTHRHRSAIALHARKHAKLHVVRHGAPVSVKAKVRG
jgi:hypothetical protein